MREDTRKKLNRMLWLERAKYAGFALLGVIAIGLAFGYETLDLKVTDTRVAGVVEAIDPLLSKSAGATAAGVNVGVALENGQHVRVIAERQHAPEMGSRIEITEHRHATGRVTHTFK